MKLVNGRGEEEFAVGDAVSWDGYKHVHKGIVLFPVWPMCTVPTVIAGFVKRYSARFSGRVPDKKTKGRKKNSYLVMRRDPANGSLIIHWPKGSLRKLSRDEEDKELRAAYDAKLPPAKRLLPPDASDPEALSPEVVPATPFVEHKKYFPLVQQPSGLHGIGVVVRSDGFVEVRPITIEAYDAYTREKERKAEAPIQKKIPPTPSSAQCAIFR